MRSYLGAVLLVAACSSEDIKEPLDDPQVDADAGPEDLFPGRWRLQWSRDERGNEPTLPYLIVPKPPQSHDVLHFGTHEADYTLEQDADHRDVLRVRQFTYPDGFNPELATVQTFTTSPIDNCVFTAQPTILFPDGRRVTYNVLGIRERVF